MDCEDHQNSKETCADYQRVRSQGGWQAGLDQKIVKENHSIAMFSAKLCRQLLLDELSV